MRKWLPRDVVGRIALVAVAVGLAVGGWQWIQDGIFPAVPRADTSTWFMVSIRPAPGPSGLECANSAGRWQLGTRADHGPVSAGQATGYPRDELACWQPPIHGLITYHHELHGPSLRDLVLASVAAAAAFLVLGAIRVLAIAAALVADR